MDKPITEIIIGGVTSVVIAGLAVIGINKRVTSLDKNKVSKDTFIEYKTSIDKQFKNVTDHLRDIGSDVKDLLKK